MEFVVVPLCSTKNIYKGGTLRYRSGSCAALVYTIPATPPSATHLHFFCSAHSSPPHVRSPFPPKTLIRPFASQKIVYRGKTRSQSLCSPAGRKPSLAKLTLGQGTLRPTGRRVTEKIAALRQLRCPCIYFLWSKAERRRTPYFLLFD